MTTGLEGKVALVTGAGRGQGRGHAIRLAEAGADVVCVDTDRPAPTAEYPLATRAELEETVAEVEKRDRRAAAVTADVRSQAELDAAVAHAVEEFGGLDVVVANAAIWTGGLFWELTEEQWAETQDIVLAGAWRTLKAAAPHLIAQRSGSIVLISSVNGVEAGYAFGHYTAAKHGVLGLMKSAALELAPYGIRVNAVLPGLMDTKMNDWQGSYDMMAGHPGGTPEDRVNAAYAWHALAGRGLLAPDATSKAVVYLASDYASEVTGVALPVDAGHLLMAGLNTNPVRP
jgi:SDR family mycofactocin-dependent oxidoreductase